MMRHATLDLRRNKPRGMIGWRADRASLKRKKKASKAPTTTRQMTFGEFQGYAMPPKLRPSSTMTMTPTIEKLPAQSMALMPAVNLVFGSCTSRKRSSRKNAGPQIGRLIQKIHLHDRNCVNVPPSTGPMPPATA